MTCYVKAARQGIAVARYHVGQIFEKGQGTPQDFLPGYRVVPPGV